MSHFSDSVLVLVISLGDADERRMSAAKQLKGVQFSFIEAVDGRSDVTMGNRLVTPPIDAIWNSHKKAYLQFLTSDKRYCLVLEDDFVIHPQRDLWCKISRLIVCEPDVVQIGWLQTGADIWLQRFYEGSTYLLLRLLDRISKQSQNLRNLTATKLRSRRTAESPYSAIPDSFLPGAHGYLISRKFAEAALTLNNPTFLAADDFLMAISKMRSFNFIRLRRSIIGQRGLSVVGLNRFTRT